MEGLHHPLIPERPYRATEKSQIGMTVPLRIVKLRIATIPIREGIATTIIALNLADLTWIHIAPVRAVRTRRSIHLVREQAIGATHIKRGETQFQMTSAINMLLTTADLRIRVVLRTHPNLEVGGLSNRFNLRHSSNLDDFIAFYSYSCKRKKNSN
jgi:hypothetical protein